MTINTNKKIIFKKRVPEPKEMGMEEMKAFEKMSVDNYRRWVVPLVDDVLARAQKPSIAILDVGCGPGLLAKEFAIRSRKFSVMGIDTSRIAINLARINCQELPNASFKTGNVNRMPFPSDYFDVVACKDTLHHFNSPKRAIKEMLRVARIGGMIYIQDLKRDVPGYLLRRVAPPKTIFEKLIYYSTRAAYTKDEIKKLLNNMQISDYKIKTRIVTPYLRKHYAKQGIDTTLLKEGFVSRYVAIVKKP